MSDEVAELEALPEDGDENTGEAEIEEESAPSEEVEQEEAAEKPKPRGVQKRIDELTGNWKTAERRAEQLQEQNAELMRHITAAPKQAEVQPQPAAGEPKSEDFESYEEWQSKLVDYRAERIVEAKFAEQDQRREAEQRAQSFNAKVQEFVKDHADFNEVVTNPTLPITNDVVELLNLSDKGPELLYHLGKNPDEAARVAGLPRDQLAMEMGRIEARLSSVQPKTQSGAPPPIEPLSDARGSLEKDPEKMSTSDWLVWREANLRK